MRAQVEHVHCDRCKKEFQESNVPSGFSIAFERYTDAAGSGATRTVDFDLCMACQGLFLRRFLKTKEWSTDLVSSIREFAPNARVLD